MGKKHKKKVYNTPRKIRHVHQKRSLNQIISSFNNNKCETCQSILANHADRFYCGKCHYSIPHNSYTAPEMELHP